MGEQEGVVIYIGAGVDCLEVGLVLAVHTHDQVGGLGLRHVHAALSVVLLHVHRLSLVLFKNVIYFGGGSLNSVHLRPIAQLLQSLPAKWLLAGPDVGGRLLVALVVAKGHRHLVHVERPVQVVEATLVILFGFLLVINAPLHLHISGVAQQPAGVVGSLSLLGEHRHVIGEESGLVQVLPLCNALVC